MTPLKFAQATIYLIVVTTGLLITWRYREAISHTLIHYWPALISIIMLGFVQLYLQSRNFVDLLETHSKRGHSEWLQLWALSSLTSYITPFQAGLAVRTAVLKRWRIPVNDTLRATLKQVHMSIWAALVLASVTAYYSTTIDTQALSLTGLSIAIIWLALMHLRVPSHDTDHRIKSWLISIWQRPTLRQTTLIFANYFLTAAAIFIVYNAVDASLSMADAILLATITTLSGLFAVLPGNVGVQELLLWYVSQLIGLSPELAVSIPVIFRLSHISTCVLLLLSTKLYHATIPS